MNSKLIVHSVLFFLLLALPKISNASRCDTAIKDNTCLQILVKDKTGQALANMVVYLEPLEGQILGISSNEVVVEQSGKSFSPYISVSQINSKVNFINKDDITHHIYSAGDHNKFSFKIRAGETNVVTQFKQASEVAMGCNIHDWMSGYLLVVNTPYFDKTDEFGQVNFNVSMLGKYKIIVWHPQMQADDNRQSIIKNINENDKVSITLTKEMVTIPLQKSDDDFEFLSDY